MRRLAFGLLVVLTLGLALSTRARCWWRGRHDPVRHPLSGFRCKDCRAVADSLDEMGFPDGGWVAPLRRTFGRGREAGVTREGWTH